MNITSQNSHSTMYDDFQNGWDARAYLEAYFPGHEEDEPTLKFIVEESKKINGNPLMVDIGSGPTVCYWAPFTSSVSGIYVTDYVSSNLRESKMWVDNVDGQYNWDEYFKLILRYEGKDKPTAVDVDRRKYLARSKVRGFLHCDITKLDPIGQVWRQKFPVVSSFYCADGRTDDKEEWEKSLRNIFSLLSPGGFYVGAALYKAGKYEYGGRVYPNPMLNEVDVRRLMKSNGFDMNTLRLEIVGESKDVRTNYDKDILWSAFLRR